MTVTPFIIPLGDLMKFLTVWFAALGDRCESRERDKKDIPRTMRLARCTIRSFKFCLLENVNTSLRVSELGVSLWRRD